MTNVELLYGGLLSNMYKSTFLELEVLTNCCQSPKNFNKIKIYIIFKGLVNILSVN